MLLCTGPDKKRWFERRRIKDKMTFNYFDCQGSSLYLLKFTELWWKWQKRCRERRANCSGIIIKIDNYSKSIRSNWNKSNWDEPCHLPHVPCWSWFTGTIPWWKTPAKTLVESKSASTKLWLHLLSIIQSRGTTGCSHQREHPNYHAKLP